MRIEYLREFAALATSLSYTKVAKRLNLSTSTLSKHMVALEQEVGQELLARTTTSVELTAQGRRFYEGILPILEQYDTLLQGLARPRGSARQQLTVHVGIRTPHMMDALARAIRTMRQKHGVEVDCNRPPFGVKYLTNLRKADAIVSFASGKMPPQCVLTTLGHDPFVAVVSKSHPLATRTSVSITRDLAQARIVRLKNDMFKSGQDVIFEVFDHYGVEPQCTYSLAASFDDPPLFTAFDGVLIIPSQALPLLRGITEQTHSVLTFEESEAVFEEVLAYLPAKESKNLLLFKEALLAELERDGSATPAP